MVWFRNSIRAPELQTLLSEPARRISRLYRPVLSRSKRFAAKKIYTILVNMPNLNSATGSWILNFSELRNSNSAPHVASNDLSGLIANEEERSKVSAHVDQ